MLLQLTAQIQLQLAQRFDDFIFEKLSRRRVAFHLAVGETLEFFDHFVEASGVYSTRAPLASQILRFAQAFANLGGKLTIVTPAVADRAIGGAAVWPGAV